MEIWIDIEDAAGSRYGDGPITTASEWQSLRRLDGAGTFAFTMPASDPRSNLLGNKRVARCWSERNGVIKEVGAGIIDQIEIAPGEPTTLRVSGDDLLRELANRTVGDLELFQAVTYSTTDAKQPCTLRYQSYTAGNDLTLPATVDLSPSPLDFLYVMHSRTFSKIALTITAANTTISDTFQIQYYNEQDPGKPSWDTLGGVINGTLTAGPDSEIDLPAAGSYPFGQSGTIEFDPPPGWSPLNGKYIIRFFDPTADLTAVTISAASVTIVEPVSDGLQRIMALAPSGWSLDPAGVFTTASSVYMGFQGESVLAALVALAEQKGEHFICSPSGRRVWWIGTGKNDSGLRAAQVTEPTADTLMLVNLTRLSDSYDLYTRIYPAGGGVGSGRVTMAQTTLSAPGFVIGPDGEYLEATAAVAAFGRIDRRVDYPDIAPVNGSKAQTIHAANALFERAYQDLARKSQLQQVYRLEVVPSSYLVWPGQTIQVDYHEWADGYHAVNISAALYVLEVEQRISTAGILTVGLTVATVYAPANDDYQALARLMGSVSTQRNTDTPASSYSSNGAGVPVNLSVVNGQIVSVGRVVPAPDGWYRLSQVTLIKLTNGIVTQVERA